ncbi:MAG: GNAT family N-acetyltransferase [Clostridia bacterium]|nr:GNAT family N-acetyltransferase [Clostridia bacterium]
MSITIRPLTPGLADDFLHFFDHVAFCDHQDWAGCYCMEGHRKSGDDLFSYFGQKNRACARELILSGRMHGYLAYDGDQVIGWCNADNKRNYLYLTTNASCWPRKDEGLRIMSMYCLTIAPQRRRQGLGTMLLQRVIADAAAQGYDLVEAYPWQEDSTEYAYHGTARMLERLGFERAGEFRDQHSDMHIYQKRL